MEAKELLLNRSVIRLLAPKDQIKEVSGLRILEDFFFWDWSKKSMWGYLYHLQLCASQTKCGNINVETKLKRRNIRYYEKNKECQFFKDQGQCGAGEREEAQMVSFISSRRLRDISLLSLCLIESEAICYESGLSEISRSVEGVAMNITL